MPGETSNVVPLNRLTKRIAPYGLAREFEESLAYLMASRPKFYDAIGRAIDPDSMGVPAAKLIAKLAREITQDTGSGPKTTVVVVQRAARWREAGKLTHEDVEAVSALFDAVEDDGIPPPDAIIAEIAPVLRKRAQRDILMRGVDEIGKGKDVAGLAVELSKVESIGVVGEGVGAALGLESFEAIKELLAACRSSTGINELDHVLGGGLPIGTLGFVVGGSGEGKSMFLNHSACDKMWNRGFVGYATLELSKPFVEARAIANLTGIPTGDIEELKEQSVKIARDRLEHVKAQGGLLQVKDFTPMLTQVADIEHWVDECEQEHGRKMDALYVDYADRVGMIDKKGDARSGYETGRIVSEGLKNLASEKKLWVWSASQSRRSENRGKSGKGTPKDLDDIADSMEKPRIAHIVVTLNSVGEERDEILYFVAKHRSGKSRQKVGPIPHDFGYGRMAPITRKEPW